MQQYQVSDVINTRLLEDAPVYLAETGRKALQQHLEKIGFLYEVKVSGSNNVRFVVQPVCVQNGRVYIDRRNGKRSTWYQVVSQR